MADAPITTPKNTRSHSRRGSHSPQVTKYTAAASTTAHRNKLNGRLAHAAGGSAEPWAEPETELGCSITITA